MATQWTQVDRSTFDAFNEDWEVAIGQVVKGSTGYTTYYTAGTDNVSKRTNTAYYINAAWKI